MMGLCGFGGAGTCGEPAWKQEWVEACLNLGNLVGRLEIRRGRIAHLLPRPTLRVLAHLALCPSLCPTVVGYVASW